MKELLVRLKENNIHISLHQNDLKVKFDNANIPEDLLKQLKANKSEIISFLRQLELERSKTLGIPRIPEQKYYVTSSSQRRLWILSQFDGASKAYNMPGFYMFEGKLDIAALESAFIKLVIRHEILRTVFKNVNGEIFQCVLSEKEINFHLDIEDIQHIHNKDEMMNASFQAEMERPFDLSSGPLLRVKLIKVDEERYVLGYVMHHIISDGWSMGIMISELMALYNSADRSVEEILSPLPIQYKDYASWQQSMLNDSELNIHKKYWADQFKGEIPVLELSGEKVRPLVKSYNGAMLTRKFSEETSKSIKQLSHKNGATLFMGLFASVNALLHLYTSQEDFVFGSPIAGRENADLEGQIGLYLNMLPLRTKFNGNSSFIDLLQNVKEVTLGAYEHQLYPFDELVSDLSLKRDMSRSALFDVMVVLQNTAGVAVNKMEKEMPGLMVRGYEGSESTISKYDLTFDFREADGVIFFNLEYNTDIYEKQFAEKLYDHLVNLLNDVVRNPSKSINKIDYLSSEEKKQILENFNNTRTNYNEEQTLPDLFALQVQRNPNKTAIVFRGRSYTYQELNDISDKLSCYLKAKYKIGAEDIVGVKLERGEMMIISILAILKCGGAYMPIDPSYPQDRINYIVEDSGCRVVLDTDELKLFNDEIDLYNECRNVLSVKPHNLAYVIYTSGSTGRPKGCMLEHRGVINRLEWMWSEYEFTEKDVILQKTTFTFDVSVWELFLPLCWGCQMVLCEEEDVAVPERILSLIRNEQVTCLHFVPSMLNIFIDNLFHDSDYVKDIHSLRLVITSGEALSVETIRKWYDKTETPIYNLYGPTEASVDVTHYATQKGDQKIPIGRPIWNIQMYILNDVQELCGIGIPGEICIGGDGLARGYLNNPKLTNEKFIINPFETGKRIYRTGDLGRWSVNGNIEYLGRKDDQVKVRGYRIELGEVEYALLTFEKINACVVQSKTDQNGDKSLVAYIVSTDNLNVQDTRSHLRKTLPEYMIPEHFIQIDALPLNSNGKIDRKALSGMQGELISSGVEYVGPRNELEENLVEIWSNVLEIDSARIGVRDNFFDLGGNSYKIIKIIEILNRKMNKKVPVVAMFKYPNVAALAEHIISGERSRSGETDTEISSNVDVMEDTLGLLNNEEED